MNKCKKRELATIINALLVARAFRVEAETRGEHERAQRWFTDECQRTLVLADVHGIELPGLEICRAVVARRKAEIEAEYRAKQAKIVTTGKE